MATTGSSSVARSHFTKATFDLTPKPSIGWANSCALIGCLGGSILSGALSERFGRKKLLILAALLFAISSVLTGWAFSFAAFVAWRIAGGVAIGIASNVSPTYIAEVSPAPWRGRLVTLNQLTIVVGILGRANRELADRRARRRRRYAGNDSAIMEWAIRVALDVHGGRRTFHRIS